MILHPRAIFSAVATLASVGCGSTATNGTADPINSSPAGSTAMSGAAGLAPTGAVAMGGSPGGAGNMAGSGTVGLPVAGGSNLPSNGGAAPTGVAASAGASSGGSAGGTMTGAGASSGGTTSAGASSGGAMTGGTSMGGGASGGGGSTSAPTDGPCDIYGDAGNECVAAYSTIRRLASNYDGPLYQVRSGSNAMNTGSGGEVHDIGMTADGFADAAAQDAVCSGTTCTISLMYDQSGRGNDLPVAKGGRSDGGEYAALDDFESIADAGPLTVGGHDVYSLYMEARQGYRQTSPGNGMPLDQEPQGIYMLADGTRTGTACCWDFGNVTPDPTQYHVMNTLFLGVAFWGRGAGSGPWFMADFEAGVWAGGSNPGDPGWGALSEPAPANENNPSMRYRYALGFLKTDSNYALRMADIATATDVTTAYEGPLPKAMDNQGAVVIGVGGDNSNNSWGTFYEGAIVLGYPDDATELAVMQNIQAAGYGQ